MASSGGAKPSRPKPSKVVKPKQKRKSTPTTRRHRFESFSKRIGKLKIDPVRRGRRIEDLVDGHGSKDASYLNTSLQEWKDMNLSENFTAFSREMAPLTESLPMILHNEDKIMDIFVKYLELRDVNSLEAIQSLLAHFAHDLDVRFEKHFQRAVATVALVAAKIEAVEAIEWSFTCLAWLFKYLSRLLIPDLRPLYDLYATYLGRDRQKPFIVRFAAESLSFLLRKAGVLYIKNPKPLDTIMKHIVDDFSQSGNNQLYAQGLMTLITESMKGVHRALHSGGSAVFQSLIKLCLDGSTNSNTDGILQILKGSLISVIHHTDAENFRPLVDDTLETLALDKTPIEKDRVRVSNVLLFTMIATRKGSRVSQWADKLRGIQALVNSSHGDSAQTDRADCEAVLNTLALVFQTAPLHDITPFTKVLDTLSQPQWEEFYLPFCYLFATLGKERFTSLMQARFQRFIVKKWETYQNSLCCALTDLTDSGAIERRALQLPQAWQSKIHEDLQQFAQALPSGGLDAGLITLCSGELDLLHCMSVDPALHRLLAERLLSIALDAARNYAKLDASTRRFALGRCFEAALQIDTGIVVDDDDLAEFCAVATENKSSPLYWSALLSLLRPSGNNTRFINRLDDSFWDACVTCLSSPSHEVRLSALQILAQSYSGVEKTVPILLQTALAIEETPPTIQSSRYISSEIRRLGLKYSATEDAIIRKAIPTYCFGILHLKLSQAWTDAIAALKSMSQFHDAETVAASLSTQWLESPETSTTAGQHSTGEAESGFIRVESDFECSNVLQVEIQCRKAGLITQDATKHLQRRFDATCSEVSTHSSSDREQALRVLNALPDFAEKQNRILVPVLLEWAGEEAPSSHTLMAEETASQRWTRKDQKSLLTVFAQFKNPRVLYRSGEVHRALLALLANGDVDIQKSALKALLTWKDPAVQRYEEHLFNMLDDSRFREEVAVFLRLDEEEAIRQEDLPSLMPILLRLLYGRAVARVGSASDVRVQQTRRKAIFSALARFPSTTLGDFINIALGTTSSIELIRDDQIVTSAIAEFSVDLRKQLGMLNMISDLTETFGSEMQSFAQKLASTILLCLFKTNNDTLDEGDVTKDPSTGDSQVSLVRAVRRSGYQGLIHLFTFCPRAGWSGHARLIMENLMGPRLEKVPIETAQSVSGTLRILSAWSGTTETASFLVDFRPQTLQILADCLVVPSAKTEVKMFVIQQILGRLLDSGAIAVERSATSAMEVDSPSSSYGEVRNMLELNAKFFVLRIGELLRQGPSKELLDACIACISRLSVLVKGPEEASTFIRVASFLLSQPTKRVQPLAKKQLLQTLSYLIPTAALRIDSQELVDSYESLCPLFAFFRDRESRTALCDTLRLLTVGDEGLTQTATLCTDLESYSRNRLDEPDFECRERAFATVNALSTNLTAEQWRPLLHSMLFHIRDMEELAIRTSASVTLRKFIDAAGAAGAETSCNFEDLVSSVLYPGLHAGMRDTSELVRSEYLSVLSHLVKSFPRLGLVRDMQVLLANDDEEASFFNNILHIQQHRRLRALRRLASEAQTGKLSGTNVSLFFIPLLEHFVFDAADDEGAQNLTGETISTLGALTQALEWQQYRATLKRFIGYITSKPELEKTVLKLVSSTSNALYRASEGVRSAKLDIDGDEEASKVADETIVATALQKTLPSQSKLDDQVASHFLPPLTTYLHLKDESTVSLRVPVAVSIVKLLKVLTHEQLVARLPSVLMDLSHILRSRDQGSRDMTRRSLAEISSLLGPGYFGFVVKEMRSALQRGYQLHVLSFSIHSILVDMTPNLKPGDLDYCASDLVSVIMDDIFGVTGQEKDAEEYISKMKEVKSSKSFDSMELLTKITTLSHLSDLIKPVQMLLMEKLSQKIVHKIDELLRRIGLGTSHNEAVADRDILVFCYQIIQSVQAVSSPQSARKEIVDDYKTRKYLIQMKSASKSGNKGAMSSYLFKLERFAFDLMRSVLRKHEDLKTPSNLSGFLPVMGDALVAGVDEVQLAVMRLLTSIITVPIPQIESDAAIYAAQAITVIQGAPSTTTELAQAALKLLSAIIRERPSVPVKETDLAYVLKRVKPDMEEPDRQGVVFNFLKAILSRKIVITEVYEVLDSVAMIMVTNHTRTARDLARGIYFQFMMEFPQGEKRFKKQLGFLTDNLNYEHVEGRQSVLELVHLLLTKTHGNVLQEVSSKLWQPLVESMASDQSESCREMAGALIGKVLERSDEENRVRYLENMRTWLQGDDALLRRVSLQCWVQYLRVLEPAANEVKFLLKQISTIICDQNLSAADDDEWTLLYHALQTFAKILDKTPQHALSGASQDLWSAIYGRLVFPHSWVKHSAAGLVGSLFSNVASYSSRSDAGLSQLPLKSSEGLRVDERVLAEVSFAGLRVLRHPTTSEQLANQTARNLVFLGRCFAANGMLWDFEQANGAKEAASDGPGDPEDDEEEDDEDEEDKVGETTTVNDEKPSALSYLLRRLAAIIRRDEPKVSKRKVNTAKIAAMQSQAAIINHVSAESLTSSLETIILPLHRITDPSIPVSSGIDPAFDAAHKRLTDMAQEILDLLRKKLGTEAYVAVMSKVQAKVRETREGRRVKRRIEAVSAPERWARDKKKKYEGKKAHRKERSAMAMGKRRGW